MLARRKSKMENQKKCNCRNCTSIISGIVFALIAVVHLLRLVLGWSVTMNGSEFPAWPSWIAVGIGAVLAGLNFFSCCCKKCGHCPNKCCNKEVNVPPPKAL
jgi:hypothetical protein